MRTLYCEIDSPIGRLRLSGDGERLAALAMETERYPAIGVADWRRDDRSYPEARAQLAAYFAGELRHFELALGPVGTPFQQQVWTALLEIPFGATESYGALARRIGAPQAARAVGLANGRNPIGLIVPCHRVIGAGGDLTGYGGGLPRKRWLLAHEARVAGGDLFG